MKEYYAKEGDVIQIPGKTGEFLVIDAEFTGGGTGHGPYDVYPDAWHVTAKKVYDGKPVGRSVKFTQNTNNYSDCIDGVVKVGKMKKPVTWEMVR